MAMKPGERRLSILQMLATMLENPRSERVTTAALAARLEVSEAALYRHFASKAQMYADSEKRMLVECKHAPHSTTYRGRS
jgi:AcrR family transcriptional regulator